MLSPRTTVYMEYGRPARPTVAREMTGEDARSPSNCAA
jgi:hypothetical protein